MIIEFNFFNNTQLLYQFSIATITNYQNLGGLSNTNLLSYYSRGQRSNTGLTKLKPKCFQGCVSSGGSSVESVSLPFSYSRGCLHSLVHDLLPPSPTPAIQLYLCFHHHISSSYHSQKRFYTPKDPCDYVSSMWIIQDNLPCSSP